MSININLTKNSQYAPSTILKYALVGLNSAKNVFPLNLPRANTNYLFTFLDSHVIHYLISIFLTYTSSFASLTSIGLMIQPSRLIILTRRSVTETLIMAFKKISKQCISF